MLYEYGDPRDIFFLINMSVRYALLVLALFLFRASSASAQPWQIVTPRQVLPVPSDGSTVNFPNVNLIAGMKYRVHATQRVIVSNSGEIADACYYINLFPFSPSVIPVSLKARNSPGNEDWFYNFWKASGFQGGSYQSSHVYDASIGSLGVPLSFRFFDRADSPSNYYSDNSGNILIDVARETPGIALKKIRSISEFFASALRRYFSILLKAMGLRAIVSIVFL